MGDQSEGEPADSASPSAGPSNDLVAAAHSLRTPLTAIMGFADLLEDTEDLATIREYVLIIRSNAEKLNDMLRDLLQGPLSLE